ncbi:unnamed protein product [Effrenium voratum]|nr:unnamed protein product [Effrenium voratum]
MAENSEQATIELEFAKIAVDEWIRQLGICYVRKKEGHDLLSNYDAHCEEALQEAYLPLSMILAQFGARLPSVNKFRAALLWLEETHALFLNSKKKDVQAWADFNAGCLRARGVYAIRLWRKTPNRSKSAQVQMLKDILTARCGNDVDAAEGEDANACAELCEGDAFAGEGADERADARNDARGSCVDQATTLVYEVHAPEDADLAAGQDEIVNNEGSAAEAYRWMVMDAKTLVMRYLRTQTRPSMTHASRRQQIQETASRACTRRLLISQARHPFDDGRDHGTAEPAQEMQEAYIEPTDHCKSDHELLAQQAAEPADRCKSDHELLAQQAYAEPADHCKSAQQAYDEPADNCKSAQQAYDEPADNCKSDHDAHPASDAQQAHMEPSDHCKFDELPAHGQAYNEPTKHCESELLGQDLNLASSAPFRACEADTRRAKAKAQPGRGRGGGRGRPMKRPAAFSAASAPVEDEDALQCDSNILADLPSKKPRRSKADSATQPPSKGKQAEPKASKAKAKSKPKAAPKAKASQELNKKRKNAAKVAWTRPSDEDKQIMKDGLPKLENYKVVPYWSRGDVSVERKNPKGEVCFASAKSIHRVTLQEVIRVCTKVAIALDKGDDLQAVLRDFFQDRVTLRRLHEEREHNPELTFTELSVPDVD